MTRLLRRSGVSPCVCPAWAQSYGVIEQQAADGIVVDTLQMEQRPEAKRENFASCSILCLYRLVHVTGDRRNGECVIVKVNQASVPWFPCPTKVRHFCYRLGTDPYAWRCGREGRKTPSYPSYANMCYPLAFMNTINANE